MKTGEARTASDSSLIAFAGVDVQGAHSQTILVQESSPLLLINCKVFPMVDLVFYLLAKPGVSVGVTISVVQVCKAVAGTVEATYSIDIL